MLSTSHPERGLSSLTLAALTGVLAAVLSALAPVWLAVGAWALAEAFFLFGCREYYGRSSNTVTIFMPPALAIALAAFLSFNAFAESAQLAALALACLLFTVLRIGVLLRAGKEESSPRIALLIGQGVYALCWGVVLVRGFTDTATSRFGFGSGFSTALVLSMPAQMLLVQALLWPQLHALRLKQRIGRLVRFDALTGTLNRRGFEETVRREFRRAGKQGQPHGLILIDLDRFRAINARYGHGTGDLVLQDCAIRLRKALGPHDVLGRVGGDAFCVLSACRDSEEARLLLGEVRAALHDWVVDHDEVAVPVAASASLAIYPHDGSDFESLYRVATRQLAQSQAPGAAFISTFLPPEPVPG
ncbi:GGDEF domain-containing protein [Andreprevotia chitinilytica]|uniref:GGDEF domain-containing protein n=1 Tax=Andreprevotia chitinilytica TaxID=396808 RepID=UPI00146FE63B|nr:GGDEF domain-containing protein [Andreprevotia chitinilytica]